MAASTSRDIPTNRSTSQHRQSLGLAASSLPGRQPYLRVHSHSVSSGSTNPSNRVNRRKSSIHVTQSNLLAAAKEAALSAQLEAVKMSQSPKENALSGSMKQSGSVLQDGPPLASMLSGGKTGNKNRVRRASEGSRLAREKFKSSAAGELRCETCGKGYKHGSCLTKHLWEHTPEWEVTSKLLISKHQQVQLLEAASVLLQMNQDMPPTADGSHEDEQSSASPAASGSSGPAEDSEPSSRSSTPSQEETSDFMGMRKRVDSFSEPFARSYRSTSVYGASVPEAHSVSMYRQWTRSSNGQDYSDEDPLDVTDTTHRFVSARFGAGVLPQGAPPVPPVPAKFMKRDISSDIEMIDEEDDEGVFGHME